MVSWRQPLCGATAVIPTFPGEPGREGFTDLMGHRAGLEFCTRDPEALAKTGR